MPRPGRDLERRGWEAVRVSAYETRWRSSGAAELLKRMREECGVDAVVFTSTAEDENGY